MSVGAAAGMAEPAHPLMSRGRVVVLTLLAMLAFAGNSLLCRAALKSTAIDPASFTWVRLVSGALVLWSIARLRRRGPTPQAGDWTSAFALFAYAAAFSFAYVSLSAATGALLLFGAVQVTMIGFGLCKGERLGLRQMAGLLCALLGLVWLLLPGLAAPPLQGSLLMLAAGAAWGAYSLRARGRGDPTEVTAGNFARTLPFAVGLALIAMAHSSLDALGLVYSMASGALASGLGYAIWYAALPGLKTSSAAAVQLSVPVLAALGGVLLLGEPLTQRVVLASLVILGGIALVIARPRSSTAG